MIQITIIVLHQQIIINLWSNGSFKCGGTAPSGGSLSKDTNILNPYINYSSNYFANSGSQPDYSGKLNVGESWDYTLKSGESCQRFHPQQRDIKELINGF